MMPDRDRRGSAGSASRASSIASSTADPEPAGHHALLERHDEPLAARLVEDQLAVERLGEPGVDDADGPALGLERVGGLERAHDDRPEAHEQEVAALAQDLAPPDREHRRLALGQAEPGVARVVERERVVLGERRAEQRPQLLLVLAGSR